jgi:hypothetical protein
VSNGFVGCHRSIRNGNASHCQFEAENNSVVWIIVAVFAVIAIAEGVIIFVNKKKKS